MKDCAHRRECCRTGVCASRPVHDGGTSFKEQT